MGTPKNPEWNDQVQLCDKDGRWRTFMVVYVDDDMVVCDSGSRLAHFTRDEFEKLFEDERCPDCCERERR